jgi:shikimate kinase
LQRPHSQPLDGVANIFLIGLMGAGKTTVGRALARRLGRPFFDSDQEIEARTGVRIAHIFEHEGEAGFRQREAAMLDEITCRPNVVMATGGGAVLLPENRTRLRERGQVIYLRANPFDNWLRVRRDKNRPLLQTEDPRGRLEALYAERDPLYRECAHFVIETGRPSISTLVGMIIMQLELSGAHLGGSHVGHAVDGTDPSRLANPQMTPIPDEGKTDAVPGVPDQAPRQTP